MFGETISIHCPPKSSIVPSLFSLLYHSHRLGTHTTTHKNKRRPTISNHQMSIHHFIFFLLFLSLSSFHVINTISIATTTNATEEIHHQTQQQQQQQQQQRSKSKINPFTPKASLIRYWNTHVTIKNHPIPNFLLSKASPLTPHHYATLTNLLTKPKPFTSKHLHRSLCSAPNILCSFEPQNDAVSSKTDANFAVYANKQFSTYGTSRLGGLDSFKNYSNDRNANTDSFRRYSSGSTRHGGAFTSYSENGNTANTDFASYGAGATASSGEFQNYDKLVNVPDLRFTTYDSSGNNHKLSFSSYGNETNSGTESFTSYGKRVHQGTSDFRNYAVSSNILQSDFTSYSELGIGVTNDSFSSYSFSGNNPKNSFKNYGTGSSSGGETFSSYRNRANVGEDTFQSYAGKSSSVGANFVNYGQSFNVGNDTFIEYGKGSSGRTQFGFRSYGLGREFKVYNKQGASFSEYRNFSALSGKIVKRWVEPGKFFRESEIKEGNVVPMPDIRDKMPVRSFLPLGVSKKLPFSSLRIEEIRRMFHARVGSATERVITNALEECEREPSRGETKRCVASAEGMIEFATSVLGRSVVVRATENVNGYGMNVMIGKVYKINGGEVTKSVSCHQSLYPYLLYYCHSVPKVRVYEADILDVETKLKINHGVAICHLDTSSWGPEHGAFVALGSSPGNIEVCHWIFENDVTWTTHT